MNLRNWLTEERARLAEFEVWWKRQQQTEPEKYPDDLEAGLWDEAFQTFDPGWLESPRMETGAAPMRLDCLVPNDDDYCQMHGRSVAACRSEKNRTGGE